ncbi:hypothetical protein TVAG_434500 [Trichomonas vaginalis G3]|uniref:RRM domain-containing protein n=1 Tax=Trichomonas vaginalis (strain ATCC PRA-98 / G3) TaxID=412133 RepID=A2DSN3_TRIV3|nr:RNA binding [Trichomonas vaginalis G3]EAY16613.1 hypothetical protein TVAG_434500 [Trichomonas vaginalis G3]KAI5532990.1 RNA binding [Trichomonas vaginalis G3]|eukprot:XP_001328836.1 hypothetical protein [Trichomonas vaginalis G3]
MSNYDSDKSEKKTLFIANLPIEALEKHVREVFEPYGTILTAFIVNTRGTVRSRGIAFVEFEKHEQAEAAMAATNGMKFWENQIRVQWAKPLPPEERERKQRLVQRKQPQDMNGMSSSQMAMNSPREMSYRDNPRDSFHDGYHESYNEPYHDSERVINDYRSDSKPPPIMLNQQNAQPPSRPQTPVLNRASTPIQNRAQTPVQNRASTPMRAETPRPSQNSQQPNTEIVEPQPDNLIDIPFQNDNFVRKDIKEIVLQLKSREEFLARILGKRSNRAIDSIL